MYYIKYKKQQKRYEKRNIRGITEQQPRHKMRDGTHETQDTKILPGTNLIWDSGSKIQDPKTTQQWINATFRLSTWDMAVLHFAHPHGQSHHISSALPQSQEVSYERQRYGRKIFMMRLTIELASQYLIFYLSNLIRSAATASTRNTFQLAPRAWGCTVFRPCSGRPYPSLAFCSRATDPAATI